MRADLAFRSYGANFAESRIWVLSGTVLFLSLFELNFGVEAAFPGGDHMQAQGLAEIPRVAVENCRISESYDANWGARRFLFSKLRCTFFYWYHFCKATAQVG